MKTSYEERCLYERRKRRESELTGSFPGRNISFRRESSLDF